VGSLLDSGSGGAVAVNNTPIGGSVKVGIVRQDPDAPGVDFPVGGDLLMTVFFAKATNAEVPTSPVTYSDQEFNDGNKPPEPILGVTSVPGTATVQ
jgi:hypothetical protein